ncbi:hypothetical protein [Cohnella sp. JJ-181]|uniref:hypothetical protein n=1 Tax=Cohnella rhizoplanae TaxID=2974897 RepID=UPI0022FF60EC|nr:hypothetical protein [Cohnella sp. JJ-181]CAI6087336.1 hypothetical protein COHCIP112018_05458 [Cohnella sp. JJ-181]
MRTLLLVCYLMVITSCSSQRPTVDVSFKAPEIHHVVNENDLKIADYTPHSETLKKIEVPEYKFVYNKDYKLRDKIVGINFDWSKKQNDIAYYDNLDVRTLEELILNNHINPNDAQNAAPFVRDIFYFMTKYPQVLASGYLVGPSRDDYRISIDGLYVPNKYVTEEIKSEFIEFCMDADELNTEENLMSWWD